MTNSMDIDQQLKEIEKQRELKIKEWWILKNDRYLIERQLILKDDEIQKKQDEMDTLTKQGRDIEIKAKRDRTNSIFKMWLDYE
jgi:sensor histidine kinase YesM